VLERLRGKYNFTQAEINGAVRDTVAAAVDAEFNKVSGFMIDRKYNAVLAHDPQTGQYTLSYERPSIENDDKELSASSLEALSSAMSRSGDFSATAFNVVREQAALIPAVSFEYKDPREDIVAILYEFYANPGNATYGAVRDIKVFYNVASGTAYKSEDRRTYERLSQSYRWVLESLSQGLAQKVIKDSDGRTSVTLSVEVRRRLQL
jgi:hypothetical protein